MEAAATMQTGTLHPARNRGLTLIYGIVSMTTLMMFVSLAVDLGRVQLVKTELRCAADAAARAASAALSSGVTAAQTAAVHAAACNNADGSAVSIDSNNDVEFGTWDSSARTFTVLTGAARSNANSIRITARRTAARGNAVSLSFARVLGRNSLDVTAVATANYTSGSPAGLIGLDGITVKNNALIASYNSNTTTNPSSGNCNSNGGMGSNGVIYGKNNNSIRGRVSLGPGASVSGFSITGTTSTSSSDLETPAVPSWSPSTNPNSISQSYTVNSSTTLPGGTYWFTSLTINAPLSFSGAATLNVNGNITIDSSLTASASQPANLKVYQIGTNRTFGDNSNNISITAVVIAPTSDFTSKNNCVIRGDVCFLSITAKNNFDFYYDEAIGGATGASGTASISVVK